MLADLLFCLCTSYYPLTKGTTALFSIYPSFHDLTCCATPMWVIVRPDADTIAVGQLRDTGV